MSDPTWVRPELPSSSSVLTMAMAMWGAGPATTATKSHKLEQALHNAANSGQSYKSGATS